MDERTEIRMTSEQRKRWERAAALDRRTLTDWIRITLDDVARRQLGLPPLTTIDLSGIGPEDLDPQPGNREIQEQVTAELDQVEEGRRAAGNQQSPKSQHSRKPQPPKRKPPK